MRMQSEPEALENEGLPVGREPSSPDRSRIDSDVRGLLRPVSTPWIVFDRDSRVDDFAKSALRVGAVFASSPSFRPEVLQAAQETGRPLAEIVAAPMPGLEAPASIRHEPAPKFFPESTDSGSSSTTEPSSLIVASEIEAPPARPGRQRTAAIAIGSGLVVAAFLAAMVGRSHANAAASAAQPPAMATPAIEIPPPAETVELEDVAPPSDPGKRATEQPHRHGALPTDAPRGFGKLTINGAAKYKNVYFDGKRMLGQGSRSFLVFCGMHTIAVTDKTEAKDVEIPCNGEFTVSK
jgi:hypothetical protein